MPASRKLPRPFAMHWGSGEIVEEAVYEGRHHVPALQLMAYTEGEATGSYSVRFCYYDHRGRFQRGPLMLGEEEIAGLRAALASTPRLRALLHRLID